MYGKCGSLQRAWDVFDAIPNKDLVSWTAIITAYARNGHGRQAIHLYHELESQGFHPDAFTYTAALDACSSSKDLTQGKALHSKIRERNLESNAAVANALMNMYSNCGFLDLARNIFENVKERNVISWNTMIRANTQCGHFGKALELYKEMDLRPTPATFVNAIAACCGLLDLSQGKIIHCQVRSMGLEENAIVASALIDFYGKCGRLDEARGVFDRIKHRSRSAHVWTAIISAYTRSGHPARALEIYREMASIREIHPDAVTFVAVLNACSILRCLEEGRQIHRMIARDQKRRSMLEENEFVANSLINLYGKCGCVEDARKVFDLIKNRDVVSWNSIISAYVQQGNHREVIHLFQRMESALEPNEITFQSVLASCSQARDFDLGCEIHARIDRQGSITLARDSKLAIAVVEMYCGCGFPDRAQRIIEEQRIPDSCAWTTTLAAYAHESRLPEFFELYLEMELHGVDFDAVTYVCLLTACSHAGMIDRGRDFFSSMADDRKISQAVEHYACVVDLLARAGWLTQADELIRVIPFEVDVETYMALLGACRMQNDFCLGCRIVRRVLQLNPCHLGAYSLLHNMLTNFAS
ncbi:pentatricopeptide repeat-containing protein At5g27110 [Selaginella moellendorffii]|nr:pentatricopeptide repeat-containing protein At5g27110 [Selaginella moellendorffii]|eukprot:XP_002991004.2 pentatricopeptide repeat-containing protein At5g27110 [Selaginella moellendorffii]